jgi:hypothetical protein
VENVREFSPIAELTRGTNHIEIAPDATPYRLTISRIRPQPDLPLDNPLTGEGVALGGRLFFDRRLSADNSHRARHATIRIPAFRSPGVSAAGWTATSARATRLALENLAWKRFVFLGRPRGDIARTGFAADPKSD